MGSGPFQTIASYASPIEAHLASALLEDHGIETLLLDEGIVSAAWGYANAVGGIKLQVRESDRSEAISLLQVCTEAVEAVQPPPTRTAPWKWVLFFLLFLGLFLFFWRLFA